MRCFHDFFIVPLCATTSEAVDPSSAYGRQHSSAEKAANIGLLTFRTVRSICNKYKFIATHTCTRRSKQPGAGQPPRVKPIHGIPTTSPGGACATRCRKAARPLGRSNRARGGAGATGRSNSKLSYCITPGIKIRRLRSIAAGSTLLLQSHDRIRDVDVRLVCANQSRSRRCLRDAQRRPSHAQGVKCTLEDPGDLWCGVPLAWRTRTCDQAATRFDFDRVSTAAWACTRGLG